MFALTTVLLLEESSTCKNGQNRDSKLKESSENEQEQRVMTTAQLTKRRCVFSQLLGEAVEDELVSLPQQIYSTLVSPSRQSRGRSPSRRSPTSRILASNNFKKGGEASVSPDGEVTKAYVRKARSPIGLSPRSGKTRDQSPKRRRATISNPCGTKSTMISQFSTFDVDVLKIRESLRPMKEAKVHMTLLYVLLSSIHQQQGKSDRDTVRRADESVSNSHSLLRMNSVEDDSKVSVNTSHFRKTADILQSWCNVDSDVEGELHSLLILHSVEVALCNSGNLSFIDIARTFQCFTREGNHFKMDLDLV
jgi:hypothetical protein